MAGRMAQWVMSSWPRYVVICSTSSNHSKANLTSMLPRSAYLVWINCLIAVHVIYSTSKCLKADMKHHIKPVTIIKKNYWLEMLTGGVCLEWSSRMTTRLWVDCFPPRLKNGDWIRILSTDIAAAWSGDSSVLCCAFLSAGLGLKWEPRKPVHAANHLLAASTTWGPHTVLLN